MDLNNDNGYDYLATELVLKDTTASLTLTLYLLSLVIKIYKEHKQFVQMWRKRKRLVRVYLRVRTSVQFLTGLGDFDGK